MKSWQNSLGFCQIFGKRPFWNLVVDKVSTDALYPEIRILHRVTVMFTFTSLSRLLAVAAIGVVAGCSSTYKTDYSETVSQSLTANWRLQDVQIVVPAALTVSEQKSPYPQADIVWREDPVGDRKAQIAKILDDAATAGATGLRGSQPVVIRLTVERFHALTFEAEALNYDNVGVLNVNFIAEVIDPASGTVLYGPERIEAAFPGNIGKKAVAARKAGITQKVIIMSHIKKTIAGWLGLGPDVRMEFSRIGG
jgi:hypothetical protein